MIKVDSGYNDGFHVEVSATSDGVGLWFGDHGFYSTRDSGMNLAAALVREIHGAREPRVWESADDVPDGVRVGFGSFGSQAIRYGDTWVRFSSWGRSSPWDHDAHSPSEYNLFTEVL